MDAFRALFACVRPRSVRPCYNMSSLDQLPRYERPSCASCRALAPECLVPIGDGAEPMCWLCAHAITEHGATLGEPLSDCGCEAHNIYPADVVARQPQRKHVATVSPRYSVDGKPDRHGGTLRQTYERIDEHTIRIVGIEVVPPKNSLAISKGIREARRGVVK